MNIKKWFVGSGLFVAVVLCVIFSMQYSKHRVEPKQIDIRLTGELTNLVGRKLTNIKVASYLPLGSKHLMEGEDSSVMYSGSEHVITEQTFLLLPNEGSVKFDTNTTVILKENLLTEKSQVNEFISLNRDKIDTTHDIPESIALLVSKYNALVGDNLVRIVSAVPKRNNEFLIPTCWIQIFKDGVWKEVEGNEITAFKLVEPEQLDEYYCRNGLVEAWGLKAENVSVLMNY